MPGVGLKFRVQGFGCPELLRKCGFKDLDFMIWLGVAGPRAWIPGAGLKCWFQGFRFQDLARNGGFKGLDAMS